MTVPLGSSVVVGPALRVPAAPVVERLAKKLKDAQPELDKYDRYYDGAQPLSFMAPEVVAAVGDRLAPLVINWPEVIVDSVARRVRRTGFKFGGTEDRSAELEYLRVAFKANGMDAEGEMAQVDALIHRVSYFMVWHDDSDPGWPIITGESPHQVTVEYEPNGRNVRAALKRWSDGGVQFARLYEPDRLRRYVSRIDATGTRGAWEQDGDSLPNPLGAVPIVPMVNRGRTLKREGRSELVSVAPIADALNKVATDMMVTSEFHTAPRRTATGLEIPKSADERARFLEEVRQAWDYATKGKTMLGGTGVQFGQLAEADLTGFTVALQQLTSAMAAIGGLPPDDLGLNTTNPASAEARRAAETTLILRAESKKRSWSGTYEDTAYLSLAVRDGITLAEARRRYPELETEWADSATPAISQAMDAAQKGVESGIYDVEQGRISVGLTPAERAGITNRAQTAVTQNVRAQMALATELQNTQGLSQNAALAAVGLLQAASLNATETPAAPPAG